MNNVNLKVCLRNNFAISDNDYNLWIHVLSHCSNITLTDSDPEVLFFVDSHQYPNWSVRASIREIGYVKKRRCRVILYNERDRPIYDVTGLYTSLPDYIKSNRFQSVPYVRYVTRNPKLPEHVPERLLCYRGSVTHPCRIDIPDIQTLDIDVMSATHTEADRIPADLFGNWLSQFKYSLCPRGHGPSSFRLYESLLHGTIPVIVSDHWVPPASIPWDEIALRVPERDIGNVLDYIADDLPNYEFRRYHLHQFVRRFTTTQNLGEYYGRAITDVIAKTKSDLTYINTYLLKELVMRMTLRVNRSITYIR